MTGSLVVMAFLMGQPFLKISLLLELCRPVVTFERVSFSKIILFFLIYHISLTVSPTTGRVMPYF